MAAIQIPKKSFPPFLLIAKLREEDFGAFVAQLGKSEPKLSRSSFTQSVAEGLPQLNQEDVAALVNEFYGLNSLKDEMGGSSEAVANAIVSAAKEAHCDEFHLSASELDLLGRRIIETLENAPVLDLISRALDVTLDHDRILIASRIFSDIRSVFDRDATRIDGYSIVHTLTLHYAQDTEHKDFYVALDDNDIEDLQEVLNRAKQKGKLLREFASAAGITHIDL
jgi:hypothetical protein